MCVGRERASQSVHCCGVRECLCLCVHAGWIAVHCFVMERVREGVGRKKGDEKGRGAT